MKHEMKLNNEPFNLIKNGSKTIEMRLYDEKRRKIKVDDFIEFTNRLNDEKILVKVIKLYIFEDFSKLYERFDKISLGYKEDEIESPSDMSKYYSEEEIKKYGVIGIEIELIK